MIWYVYLWFRPNGIPLYVGLGKHRVGRTPRWASHTKGSSNRHLASAFHKYGINLPIVILIDNISAEEAKSTEVAFIAAIGRHDLGKGPLVNHTDGGDGLINPNAETRRRISVANSGRKHQATTERGKRISAAKKGKKFTDAHKQALADSWKNRDRTRSADLNARVSATMTGRKLTEEHKRNLRKPSGPRGPMPIEQKERISKTLTGRKLSEETKEKLRVAATRAWADPEIRERQVAAIQAYCAPEDTGIEVPK